MTDGAEQDGVAIEGGFDGLVGEGGAGLVDRVGAHEAIFVMKFMAARFRHGVQHFDGLPGDFGADAVAFDNYDVLLHVKKYFGFVVRPLRSNLYKSLPVGAGLLPSLLSCYRPPAGNVRTARRYRCG